MVAIRTETLSGPSVNCTVVAKNASVSRLNYSVVTLMPLALNERRMSAMLMSVNFLNDVCGRVQITPARRPFAVSCIRAPAQVQVRMTATRWA